MDQEKLDIDKDVRDLKKIVSLMWEHFKSLPILKEKSKYNQIDSLLAPQIKTINRLFVMRWCLGKNEKNEWEIIEVSASGCCLIHYVFCVGSFDHCLKSFRKEYADMYLLCMTQNVNSSDM